MTSSTFGGGLIVFVALLVANQERILSLFEEKETEAPSPKVSNEWKMPTNILLVPPRSWEPVSVETSGMEWSKTFCEEIWDRAFHNTTMDNPEPRACRLYTDQGKVVTNRKMLAANTQYNVVPYPQRFVWPPHHIGHKVTTDIEVEGLEKPVVIETLSTDPPIFTLHNFMTNDEVDWLVNNAKKVKMERSTGGLQQEGSDSDVNQGEYTSRRTSSNSWDVDSEISRRIQRRSFDMLRYDQFEEEQADGLQIVKYTPGQFYHSHTDWFELDESQGWNWDPSQGGSNRFATVFIYLSDTELGGETVFPLAERGPSENLQGSWEDVESARNSLFNKNQLEYEMTQECREKFSVVPQKGLAVLFYHQDRSGTLDRKALHGACPVLKGEKWGANLWIWNDDAWSLEKENGGVDPNYRAVRFLSKYHVPLALYWVNDADEHVLIVDLTPMTEEGLNSFVNHRFVVKDPENEDVVLHHIKVRQDPTNQLYTVSP